MPATVNIDDAYKGRGSMTTGGTSSRPLLNNVSALHGAKEKVDIRTYDTS